ncbi:MULTISPECIES: aminoglycoside phosphotransferase family protein [unclassified Paenibacillus]|uniref:aminoglycoside phosphotransferase family protein n=2 Tax=unclassified Paenibacillus TaxID=185978 RepID=UPI0024065DD8|nr:MULTISPECIES: aminoglycoside phosphotransferase family protein [unclassified Paenibacillus]MDF9855379.1 aminoglycoside phosphotransferase (APT) family kinase protein [Paenibacillus sp. PastF-1]MDH6508074.1 aminoglycoside phosphotransferase (APT) family kinase protein [Paenibacillus sp. PastM-3]MDF9842314.1 aminoglycoside phosphotransferase (APT) family kinase protein [Paenibacillus sp. PastF-2]MDF9848809.1 aminoglycoside phosphotransferase (APT) family kinase protein [Paenibacillus sp. PastM
MQLLTLQPYELHYRVESTLGAFEVISDLRPGSTRTGVWKLRAMEGQKMYYLKTFSRKERWHPEVYAYKHWVNGLQPYVPELIAVYEGEGWQAILITAIEGTIMREAGLQPPALHAAYCKAGKLTRQIHESQCGEWFGRPDQNGKPIELYHHSEPVTYIRQSLTDLGSQCLAANLLEPAEEQCLEWALAQAAVFAGAKPVPVSWDSTPGNWLVGADGEFAGMIDFENMLWGVEVDSFAALFGKYFISDEASMKAFFAGYGADILREKQIQIRISCIKLALGDIYWGTWQTNPGVAAKGRRLLQAQMNCIGYKEG